MDVLIPSDDSEPAMKAVEHTVREYPDAALTLLHVIDPSIGAYGEGGVYAYDSLLEVRREAVDELLENAAEIAADHDGSVERETVVGSPGNEIVAVAESKDVDHIVVGSHGRSGASRVLLGSVAERVVRRASVPVMIVR
ncbi:universal stress protein [Natrinema soli]|uniref:Universal stress protein n=1 Tax=Natrinema soli TaxID=1930624 RepID=A0ABD5SJ72_9EURY|nr:universal stress protein [Natrinema soli]